MLILSPTVLCCHSEGSTKPQACSKHGITRKPRSMLRSFDCMSDHYICSGLKHVMQNAAFGVCPNKQSSRHHIATSYSLHRPGDPFSSIFSAFQVNICYCWSILTLLRGLTGLGRYFGMPNRIVPWRISRLFLVAGWLEALVV